MSPDVKQCVDARLNFFEQYYTVPEVVQGDVDAFRRDVLSLAENCADATAFETNFVSSGLNDRFTNLITRCTPKPYSMTAEEKTASEEVKKQMREENKGQLAKDIAGDVADSVLMEMDSDAHSMSRQMMIETGVYDEYTRATNAVEDIGWLAGSLGKLFRKKKDKN